MARRSFRREGSDDANDSGSRTEDAHICCRKVSLGLEQEQEQELELRREYRELETRE